MKIFFLSLSLALPRTTARIVDVVVVVVIDFFFSLSLSLPQSSHLVKRNDLLTNDSEWMHLKSSLEVRLLVGSNEGSRRDQEKRKRTQKRAKNKTEKK